MRRLLCGAYPSEFFVHPLASTGTGKSEVNEHFIQILDESLKKQPCLGSEQSRNFAQHKDEDCEEATTVERTRVFSELMSSLTWSLGRYSVSLIFHCASPSSSSFRRALSCTCRLPAFSGSATHHIVLPPTASAAPDPQIAPSTGQSLLESVHLIDELPAMPAVHGGLLRSALSVVLALAMTVGVQGAPSSRETFEDVPQTLSGGDKGQRIQRPKSAKAESCTRKCVSTCIRGGAGGPGEGPLNVRRPLVVFKEGFRSRNYCLIECSEICNLIGDGDDGP